MLTIRRPLAKVIAAKNIVEELMDQLGPAEKDRIPERRQAWTAIVLRHLDAYDQRG